MTVDEAFARIKKHRPEVVFVNGKTSTGKTTFAIRLKSELEYGLIEMDEVARRAVIRPLGLPDDGSVHVELYKLRNHLDWISIFLSALQKQARESLANGHPVVFDGAMPNIATMRQLFSGLPKPEIIFFHPLNLSRYETFITKRFELTHEKSNSGLPPSFWRMIDETAFREYCRTHILSPYLKQTINNYAKYSLASSDERLLILENNFKNVLVVEI